MKRSMLIAVATAAMSFVATDAAMARRGADDPAGHVRQGRGADDGANHDVGDDRGRGGHGADDGVNHDVNDDRGGATARRGADDPANHDVGDDRGRNRGGRK